MNIWKMLLFTMLWFVGIKSMTHETVLVQSVGVVVLAVVTSWTYLRLYKVK